VSVPPSPGRRPRSSTFIALSTVSVLVGSLLAVAAAPAAGAVPGAEVPQSSLGYPAFVGSADPVPDTGVDFAPGGYLSSVFAADVAAGAGTSPGQDFWLDRMLARTGTMFDGTENAVAFTRGRTAFMKTHNPTGLGWRGDTAYVDTTGKGDAFAYTVTVDGTAVTMTEQSAQRRQTPSYFSSVFTGGGITLTQTKYITDQNVMVAGIRVSSDTARTVKLTATSPHASRAVGDELVGVVSAYNRLTTIFPRLSGDGFAADGSSLARSALCNLCHTMQPADQVSLFTARKSGSAGQHGGSVGTYICTDLSCHETVRLAAPLAPNEVRASVDRKIDGTRRRTEAFVESVLETAGSRR